MSGRTHDVGEWLSMLSLGVGVWASWAALMWLLVDAHRTDFDPRPLLARAVDRLLVEAVNARYLLRDAAITCAALLALLLPATETTT